MKIEKQVCNTVHVGVDRIINGWVYGLTHERVNQTVYRQIRLPVETYLYAGSCIQLMMEVREDGYEE